MVWYGMIMYLYCLISNRERLALIYFNPDGSRNSAILVFAGLVPKKKDTEMSTTGKKTTKSDSQPAISLEEIQKKIISEDPSKWSVECLRKFLLKLGQTISGSRDTLAKRIISLKSNPCLLQKIIEKKNNVVKFRSRLYKRDIPPEGAPWTAESSQYPKVNSLTRAFCV